MRKFIRLIFSFLGYNVYFIKRKQKVDTLLSCSKEYEDKEWANEKIAKRFESKQQIIFFNLILSKIIEHKIIINKKHICDIGCGSGIY